MWLPVPLADTAAGDVGSGINGYGWLQIARHCAANKHLFSGRELEFVESMPDKLSRFGDPKPKQAAWLRDIFHRRFGGRI